MEVWLISKVPLSAGWGTDGAFPSLYQLWLYNNPGLHGNLPARWGSGESLKSLSLLSIENCNISGVLPYQWGSSLQGLNSFLFSNNSITGESFISCFPLENTQLWSCIEPYPPPAQGLSQVHGTALRQST